MHVMVNSGFLSDSCSGEYLNYLRETFKLISKNHPEDNFVFLCEREYADQFKFGANTKVHIIKHPAASLWLRKYWYDIRLPAICRKHQADVFITTSGFCSLTAKLPQCMITQDLAFLYFPSFFTKIQRLFYKRYTKKFIDKAKTVVTLSAFAKLEIIKNYKTADNKIDTVYNGVSEIFKPVDGVIRDEVKEKYTAGKDFFLYHGAMHPAKNLINLLKAFSLFKKRQQSNMKLLLCGKPGTTYKSFSQSLLTYKYRADVVSVEMIDESQLAKVTASAYALVYPVYFDGFSAPVMEAMRCNVPVITSGNSPMQEITGNAALYADPENHKELAEKLMRLYKDENLRNELIIKGEIVARQYTWDRTADHLWLAIKKTVIKGL